MTWQENLFSNLLVIFILLALAIIIYCRVTGKTMLDVFRDIKKIVSGGE